MNRLFRIAICIIAAVIFANCSTDLTEDVQMADNTVELTLHTSLPGKTRTVIGELSENGTYPVLWDKNGECQLQVFEYVDGQLSQTVKAIVSEISEDQKSATFKANFAQKNGKTFDYYAYYQSGSYRTDYFYLSGYQSPRAGSFDPNAALMLAKSEGHIVQGGELDFDFEHLIAYSRMKLVGLENALDGSKITEIQFFPYNVICGNFDLNVPTGDVTPRQLGNGAYNILRLDVEKFGYDGTEPFEVWFTTFPVDDIKSFQVYVFTENGQTYSKYFTVNDSKTFSLEKGVVSRYTVDMADHTEDIYQKQKTALVALYNATNGDNWTNNENWCSDKPLNEWYGISTNNMGYVDNISLSNNNLNGTIPLEIGNLSNLHGLYLQSNQLTGNIPKELGNLTNLIYLRLDSNRFSGNIPPELGNLTKLYWLFLDSNQLSGKIPMELGSLTHLGYLYLGLNKLSGSIPSELGNLIDLRGLYLNGNQLSGTIPSEIGNLKSLEYLYLNGNQFTGTLPSEIGGLSSLINFDLRGNELSGTIPQSIQQASWWSKLWVNIVDENNFDLSTAVIPAPEFSLRTLDGTLVNNSIYSLNKYTILFQWAHWCGYTQRFTPTLVELYERYRNHGVDVLGWTTEGTLQDVNNFISSYGIKWKNVYCDYSDSEHTRPLNIYFFPAVNVVDSNGHIVFNCISDSYNDLEKFLREHLGEGDIPEIYESTDFSRDKTTRTIQKASKGNGINIVLMGDGFSDRQIADGTYDKVMNTAAAALFSEEPYKSFKDMFNVHVVYAVSKNEGYHTDGNTVFGGYFGGGTFVGGDDGQCFNYALNAVSDNEMDETLIVVMMNSPAYAGTCWMYYPYGIESDYGSGVSVAYFPIGTNDEALYQILHHEACGHGFSKLADEYDYGTTVSAEEVNATKAQQVDWGWWKNVDFTGNPAEVRWNYFLSDYRYANDGLGVFEGGLTHSFGVWRPTDNSIMRYNYGGFNAPSREAIYYRIHKLAYGDSWQYNYEDFVKYDEINRKAATSARVYAPSTYKPTHPPVVVNKSWRDAK